MDVLQHLFREHFGDAPNRVKPVQGGLGGSGRQIIRLASDTASAIGIVHQVREENAAFLAFSRHFRRHGLPVPEIYAEDLDRNAYLQEDLGDTTLYQFLNQHRSGDTLDGEVLSVYHRVVDTLPRFQIDAARDFDYAVCYPRAAFDAQSIGWDLNYFKYYFLRGAGIPFSEQALEDDFNALTRFLTEADSSYFLYRDFQSRNIMLRDGQPWFLDYQGGRRGPLQYDIASLLFDAKADLPPAVRQHLLDRYLDALAGHVTLDRAAFMRHYYAFVYVRILQALGAYGFRGFFERKPHFLQSIPFAARNLRWLSENVELPVELPELMRTLRTIATSPRFEPTATAPERLTIRVYSFSYLQGGPPADESGNGGGFVFDARALPNPGREERYKTLTGRDPAVIEYLEASDSVRDYLTHVAQIVEGAVDVYVRRRFTSLMVAFGCTGGQHRSVYLAEQIAKRLRERGDVEVILRHVQQEHLNQ